LAQIIYFYPMNKRALKILFDTYWSPSGWKQEIYQSLSGEDFAYAKSKGLMFDPLTFDHGEAVVRLLRLVKQIDRRKVADAFLASLSTRRLDWRSPLGSYAVFQHMQLHSPIKSSRICKVCGFCLSMNEHDFNVLSFERHKWGGVRHDSVEYAIFDLEQFLESATPRPTQQDFDLFRHLTDAISAVNATVTSAALQSHLARILKSNKAEREVLIAILGFCGILGTVEYPGYNDTFCPTDQRILPSRRFVNMPYPVCWWHGGIGLNQEKLKEYFSHALA
jgi:hypothetical protein